MTKLLNHLPAFYREIKDFRELSKTVTKEYDELEKAFEQIENDQFIITSSEPAIYRREKVFNIVPDKRNETLSFRKRRLLTRMQENPPYVDEYLKELLDSLLGKNMTVIEMDKLLLEMEVLVHAESSSFYLEVQKILERVVPLNVDITTAVLLIKEFLALRLKAYGFDVPYKRTNKFHTAPVQGIGRLNEKGEIESEGYTIPIEYPRTNLFRTASVSGSVANESKLETYVESYAFRTYYPVTGKFVARSV